MDENGLRNNTEQAAAIQVVYDHVVSGAGRQLLMYIGGCGGTGKSHVIRSIVQLFTECGIRDTLLLSAPTGAAAIVINGYTIHALTLLPQTKGRKANAALLESVW
ncbi:hypothetical protein CALCODRAFT_436018 [Calocera cornea HHB12733]|uniref:ATP-dependent DNA helicase n=1 Tax=Calocera cornea HHB12733 TaxID=1353952 RepID=A0A165F6T8_9BASI|nr:hypothetical protein CALCODRAFT_436018 [Calocera cornea HHB12733]